MSNLKYKSSNSAATTSTQPIWCSLSTPSQIARKYASIAPIWCHISRPRQLKKKFASTFQQAQNLLTRQHSKDNSLNQANDLDEDEDDNETTSNTNYTNDYDSHRSSIRKRDSSLDIKKKDEKPATSSSTVYPSTNSYLYNNNLSNGSSSTTPLSSTGSRWQTSSASKLTKQPYSLSKETYDNTILNANIGSMYDEPSSLSTNHSLDSGVSSVSGTTSGISSSARRPNKYNKYQQSSGAKTEKIVSKSSKSSPNLLSKDYDHYYTERYDRTSPSKWHSTASTASTAAGSSSSAASTTNPYHSTVNPYLSGTYNNYSSYLNNYNSSHNSNGDAPSSTSSSSAYNHYNSYNPTSSNREDKWNELDSMLGAQSALLSRLESDFVANLSKLKANSNLNSLSSTSGLVSNPSATSLSSSSAHQLRNPTYNSRVLSSNRFNTTNQLNSKSSNSDAIDLTSSYLPSRYRTPTSKKTLKYGTSKIDENEVLSNGSSDTKTGSSKNDTFIKKLITSSKTEPIVDLIKSLGLSDNDSSNAKKLTDQSSIELDSSNTPVESHPASNHQNDNTSSIALNNAINNSSSSLKTAISADKIENDTTTRDFVDEFINDYLNNTLKTDTSSNSINKAYETPSATIINTNNSINTSNHHINNSLTSTTSNNNINNEINSILDNHFEHIINASNHSISDAVSANTGNNASSTQIINETKLDNPTSYTQNWFVIVLFLNKRFLAVCFGSFGIFWHEGFMTMRIWSLEIKKKIFLHE